ncbi:MAG: hypothetical protein WA746_05350, partial [Isosphaeraceae bacterium]
MSEHLFAWRTTTTARLTDDAEAMGNDLDPVLCTVRRAGHCAPTTVRHPTPWPVVPHGPSVASGPDVPAQCDRAAPI